MLYSDIQKPEDKRNMCEAFDLIMAKHYKEGYIEGYQEEYRQGYKEVTGKDLTPEQ